MKILLASELQLLQLILSNLTRSVIKKAEVGHRLKVVQSLAHR